MKLNIICSFIYPFFNIYNPLISLFHMLKESEQKG